MPNPDTFKALLTEHETCRYLGVSRSFLARSRSEGILPNRTPGPPFVKIGRAIRYAVADLEAWIQANRRELRAFDGGEHA